MCVTRYVLCRQEELTYEERAAKRKQERERRRREREALAK